jgi:MFS-type transporter involved in bile tolerance (Atg22 family)
MLITRWHQSFSLSGVTSGFTSVLPALLSPFVGHFVDQLGMQLEVCSGAAVATTLAYSLLLYVPSITPFVPLTLLSMSLAVIPTITLAVVPLCVPSDAYGLAYGSMEVVDSLGLMSGNYLFGLMYSHTHSYELGLTCLAVMSVSGVMLFGALMWMERTSGAVRLDRFRHYYDPIHPYSSARSHSHSYSSLYSPESDERRLHRKYSVTPLPHHSLSDENMHHM